jgi:hypothetical protein
LCWACTEYTDEEIPLTIHGDSEPMTFNLFFIYILLVFYSTSNNNLLSLQDIDCFLYSKRSKNGCWKSCYVCNSWSNHNILEPTTGVTFFNSGFKSDPTELFPSIVLVIGGEKRFPPPNFNLMIVRIQRGGGSWMLLNDVLHYWEGYVGPRLKNVM